MILDQVIEDNAVKMDYLHPCVNKPDVARHAKRYNFYTNKFGAEILSPEKAPKLRQNLILDITA